jgi:hypothetical protein
MAWVAGVFFGAALTTTLPLTFYLAFANPRRPLSNGLLLWIPIDAVLNVVAFLTATNLVAASFILGPFCFVSTMALISHRCCDASFEPPAVKCRRHKRRYSC